MLEDLKQNVRRLLAAARGSPERQTAAVSGGWPEPEYYLFQQQERTPELVQRWQRMYDHGGIMTEAIDCYPLYTLAKGLAFKAESPKDRKDAETFADDCDLESRIYEAVLDCAIAGDAFQEKIPGYGFDVVQLAAIDPATVKIVFDALGNIVGYRQTAVVNGTLRTVLLEADAVLHLRLWSRSGSMYGRSLIRRAFAEIARDEKIAAAIGEAIYRHGFRKYHIRCGTPESGPVGKEFMDDVEAEFRDLKVKNEFVSEYAVEIKNIDQGEMKVGEYHAIPIQRLCASIGVPEEILGLGRGSTEATANVRLAAFYDKISSIQKKVARAYTKQVIEPYIGRPGAVRLIFNDINPEDEAAKARWIAEIMKASGQDPFAVVPQDWVKQQFGVPEDEAEE